MISSDNQCRITLNAELTRQVRRLARENDMTPEAFTHLGLTTQLDALEKGQIQPQMGKPEKPSASHAR